MLLHRAVLALIIHGGAPARRNKGRHELQGGAYLPEENLFCKEDCSVGADVDPSARHPRGAAGVFSEGQELVGR